MDTLTVDSTPMRWTARAAALSLLGALAAAVAAAVLLSRLGPPPAADVARGSEDAFAHGLHRRELPPGSGPQRWTTPRAVFDFRGLPGGPATLIVELREVRGPVTVVAGGVVLGQMAPGTTQARFALPDNGGREREVELRTDGFRAADGRVLGARLGRVALQTERRPLFAAPGAAIALAFPALVVVMAGLWAGMRPSGAWAASCATLAFEAAMLWPAGLVHSAYASHLAIVLAVGGVAAGAFARAVARRHPSAASAAFVALTAGWLVQVAAGTATLMVVSDAVFHANKLAAVAAGGLFPLSVTQHARPFRFPYGVAFYALLTPLARAGIDTTTLVRAGAAAGGLLATAALFLVAVGPAGPRAAALAAVLFQALPGAFDIAYSYGNLSNAFGQAVTVLFFCWWAGRAPGGWPAGAALLATAMLSHFSSLVFALCLVLALVVVEWRSDAPDRARLVAAVVGLAAAAAYYAHFTGLVLEQVPRLLEGGGQGRGASRSAADAARLQVLGVLTQWGLPALVLAWQGRPRPRTGAAYDRRLTAYWVAGLALAVPAVLSPLEVRYLYALTAAVGLCAGAGAARLHAAGGARRLVGWALVAGQVAIGLRALVEAIVFRYRS